MRCPDCQATLPDEANYCTMCGADLSRCRPKRSLDPPSIERYDPQIRRWALIVALAIGIAGTVWGGLAWLQEQQRLGKVRADIQKVIGKDNGYTESLLKVENDPSGMNYLDLFTLCERTITGRNDLMVELRGLGATPEFPLVEQLIAFMGVENEWARAKRAFYQRQLELSVDVKQSERLVFESREYEARVKLNDAAASLKSSASTLSDTYQNAIAQEATLANALEASGLQTARFFSKYQQSNMAVVLQAQKSADVTTTSLGGSPSMPDTCATVEKPIKGLKVKDIGDSTIVVVNPAGWKEEQIEHYIRALSRVRSQGLLACLDILTKRFYGAGSIYLLDSLPEDQRALREFAVYRDPGLSKVAPYIRGQYEWSTGGREEASIGFKIGGGKQGMSLNNYRKLF